MDVERLTEYLDSELANLVEQKSLPKSGIDPGAWDSEFSTYFGMGGFDRAAFESSRGVWAQGLGEYRASLHSTFTSWTGRVQRATSLADLSGILDTSLPDFENVIRRGYTKAFQAGALKMGNPYYRDLRNMSPADLRFINTAVRTEMGYLKDFLGKVQAPIQRGMAPPMYRIDRYVRTLDSQMFNGMVAAAAPNHVFWWELSGAVASHCPDCISLELNNPYTKQQLPTVPRAGETACHFNCQCTLRVQGLGESEMGGAFPGAGLPMSAQSMVTTTEGMPVTEGIQKLFDDLYGHLNLVRGKIMVESGESLKRWIAQRVETNRAIINLAKQYNVRVIPRWGVKDIMANLESLVSQGLTHITDFSQTAVGRELYLVDAGAMRMGTVVGVSETSLTLNIAGRDVVFGSANDFLGFGRSIASVPPASVRSLDDLVATSKMTGLSAANFNRMKQNLRLLPDAHLAYVDEILMVSENRMVALWRSRSGRDYVGAYQSSRNRIYLQEHGWKKSAVFHEVGHAVWKYDTHVDRRVFATWHAEAQAGRRMVLSQYSLQSAEEYFCEMYQFYVRSRFDINIKRFFKKDMLEWFDGFFGGLKFSL